MSTDTSSQPKPKAKRINLRRPDVMEKVKAQVLSHYRSDLVDRLRTTGEVTSQAGRMTIKLAKEFGFCYGVERCIDLAYAALKVFPDKPLYILGEIIHNPEVNNQIRDMGIRFLSGPNKVADIDDLGEDDIVIIPAFGTEVATLEKLKSKGCQFGDKKAFLKQFEGNYSIGFDPDQHLRTVGIANQTTMMRNETEEVQRRIKAAIVQRFGEENVEDHFRFFDTICGATQERQDALGTLLKQPMDLLLVIGGYNSSNTSHLAEMGESIVPTYFITNADGLTDARLIRHWDQHTLEVVETRDWLPDDMLTVGITAGASCPNNLIEDVICRLLELRGASAKEFISSN